MRPLLLILISLMLAACSSADDSTNETEVTSDNPEPAEIAEDNKEAETTEETGEEEAASTTPAEPVEIIRDDREGIVPTRIEIPAIDVDAETLHLGLLDNGEMEVPDTLHQTGWYEPGYNAGEPGNSVIAGHVDDTVDPGVFSRLHELEEGDDIIVHGEEGDSLTFTVYDKELFDADNAPVENIFGYSHRSLLNLITCEGPYDYEEGGTPNRWVIYTELNI